jgi:regulatory protein
MKKLTPQQALEKILRYCAYQERSHLEVKKKLYDYGLFRSEVDELLAHLVTEGFLNEERFARAFAGGKFRMKKWGRIKIVHELESKGVSKNCIKAGLKEIDPVQYEETLRNLLEVKYRQIDDDNLFVLRDKSAKYAIQKGYEPDLVWSLMKEIAPDR